MNLKLILKLNSNAIIVKHKARLVVKRFIQQYDIHFYETFFAVKITTLRLLLSLTTSKHWHLA